MAYVELSNLNCVTVSAIGIERTPESTGALALDNRVSECYRKYRFADFPMTEHEAHARGVSQWNGLTSSAVRTTVSPSPHGLDLVLDVAPTRYLMGEATRKAIAEYGPLHPSEMQAMSPRMLGVSLLVLTDYQGAPCLIGQIKGRALGKSQIHAALAAGNVDGALLQQPSCPLVTALNCECLEEACQPLNDIGPFVPAYLVAEPELGCITLTYATALARPFDCLLAPFRKGSLEAKNTEPEVRGLACIPIAPVSGGEVFCTFFEPSASGSGLARAQGKRVARPYTEAILGHLSQPGELARLSKRLGLY